MALGRLLKPAPGPERAKGTLSLPADQIVTDPARLRWGVVSTVKAPLRAIARFAAWHLEAGAAHLHLYFDAPAPATADFLAAHPAITVTACDDAYWSDKPEKARKTHQLRQAFNASRSYRGSTLDWLAHIDVDEFLLVPQPLARTLAAAPPDCAYVRLHPAEMLAQPDPFEGETRFKLTAKAAGARKRDLLEIYPRFGAYVPEGFLSYTGGKNIARVGLPDIRFGIHAVLHKGAKLTNGHVLPDHYVGHAHAPDWSTFQRHMAFRMAHGSYRRKSNEKMVLNDILQVLQGEGNPDILREFFDEMCAATPARLDLLRAHDMLVTARLDLDTHVARHFGPLPKDAA